MYARMHAHARVQYRPGSVRRGACGCVGVGRIEVRKGKWCQSGLSRVWELRPSEQGRHHGGPRMQLRWGMTRPGPPLARPKSCCKLAAPISTLVAAKTVAYRRGTSYPEGFPNSVVYPTGLKLDCHLPSARAACSRCRQTW